MSKYERKSFIVAVLALIVATGGIVLAYFAIDASWKIAKETGSLDKAELVIGLKGHPFPTTGRIHVIVGAQEMSTTTVPVVGAIPFTLMSNGKKSVEGISLNFQYPSIFNRSALEHMSTKATGDYISQELKHVLTQSGDISFVSYRLPQLNPGVAVLIAEPFFLSNTNLKFDAPVRTKDGVNLTIPVEMSYSKEFAVSVNGKDISVRHIPIGVSIEKAASLDELLRGAVPRVVDAEQKSVRGELSFLNYLGSLIFSSPKRHIYLVHVPLKEASFGKIRVFGPTDTQKVGVAEFRLLSWKLLFTKT